MANTLTSFLVGIGLDFDTNGAKQAESSMGSIKRSALQAGAAVAGAFGTKAITADVSSRTNAYRQQAEAIGTTTEALDAMARVYEREGGSAQSLFSQLEAIKRLRAGLLTGDTSWIPEGALAGLDTSAIIGESDPVKAYQNILAQLSQMSVEQRLNVSDALGLDSKSINLAIKGADYLQTEVERALDRRPLITQLQEDSEEFSKNWYELWDNVASLTDEAGSKIIPKVNEITGSINDFFDSNREGIQGAVGGIFSGIAENLELIAAASVSLSASKFGSILTVMGKNIPLIGGAAGKLGLVAKSLGQIGLAYSVSSFGASKLNDLLSENFSGYDAADEKFTKFIYDSTGIDLSRGNVYENSGETVITPSDVAPLSKPVTSAQDYIMDRGKVFDPYTGQQSSRNNRPIINNIYLDSKMIKQTVNDIIDEQDEQTIKDLRSPLVD